MKKPLAWIICSLVLCLTIFFGLAESTGQEAVQSFNVGDTLTYQPPRRLPFLSEAWDDGFVIVAFMSPSVTFPQKPYGSL